MQKKIEKSKIRTRNRLANAVRKRPLGLEQFEPRQLMAARIVDTDLVIQADDKGSQVSVDIAAIISPSGVPDLRYRVTENGKVTDFRLANYNIQQIKFLGSPAGDTFTNNTGSPSLVFGNGGRDTLIGGSAADTIFGGTGDDVILGRGGSDFLSGEENDDFVNGGENNDFIMGGANHDTLGRFSRNGILYSEPGADIILGESGNDTIDGDAGNDQLNGGIGDDTIRGGSDNDTLGEQVIYFVNYDEPGNDTLEGQSGSDTLRGGTGNDRMLGGTESDILYGGNDQDTLYGEGGADILYGEAGNDSLYGGDRNVIDLLFGGANADRMLLEWGEYPSDLTGEDAAIRFVSGNLNWQDHEIIQVDQGLNFVHELTGNTRMLKMQNGQNLNMQRVTGFTDPRTMADNDNGGRIRFGNLTFNGINDPAEVAIHELAHNFDDNSIFYPLWLSISGWSERTMIDWFFGSNQGNISLDGNWFYDPNTIFVRDYGRTNPREDWSTCWELYYRVHRGTSVLPTDTALYNQLAVKMNVLDLFVTTMRVN